jgi:hypothetical protein
MGSQFLWAALLAAAMVLTAAGLANAADIVPNEVMMPGTQPNEVGNFESPDKCDNCHGGYDAARAWSNEPAFGWRGGAMGNAGRDPIFWATLAIAEQDFDGAGDLCIRCHSAAGWYAGRSTPTDGSGLAAGDDDGIDCEACHRATNPDNSDPLLQGVMNPGFEAYDLVTGEGYYGSGILSVWNGSDKLGPYGDAEARHQFEQSAFHRGDICGSCHDVSNPVVGDLAPNNGTQPGAPPVISSGGNLGGPTSEKAAFNNPPYAYGIVERTFSEYKAGAIDDTLVTNYGDLPADLRVAGGALDFAYQAAMLAGGTYEDGSPRYFNCQGCHMRPDIGEGCNKKGVPTRSDLPKHDQSGGNYWMWPLIKYQDQQGTLRMGGDLTPTQLEAMDAGQIRAETQLQLAANLEVIGNSVRITNFTGHKLITGYPEGRRMWLNIRWYDGNGTLLREDGTYGPLVDEQNNPVTVMNPATGQPVQVESILDLHDSNTKIYEAHYGMTQEWADVLLALHPPTLALSYDRVTGATDFSLGDLAALPNPDDHHETFHFALNNVVVKDNRIPPYGMAYDVAWKRNALPVPASQYGNPGPGGTYDYHDAVDLSPPATATYAEITLYYQGTSWEYIQFLYLANNGTDPAQGGNVFLGEEGVNMLDAWLNAVPDGPMVPPFTMASATWGEPGGCTPSEPGAELTCDDGLDNDCDGLIDTADPDCPVCTPTEPGAELTCDDGLDNDCDGLIDGDDADCAGCTPTEPGAELTCDDGLDNDCDGFVDVDDQDCVAVDCAQFQDRASCNAYPACRWKKNACVDR